MAPAPTFFNPRPTHFEQYNPKETILTQPFLWHFRNTVLHF